MHRRCLSSRRVDPVGHSLRRLLPFGAPYPMQAPEAVRRIAGFMEPDATHVDARGKLVSRRENSTRPRRGKEKHFGASEPIARLRRCLIANDPPKIPRNSSDETFAVFSFGSSFQVVYGESTGLGTATGAS